MIAEQKAFVIPEHTSTASIVKALDEAFADGWRLAAGIHVGADQILILDRRALRFENLNDLTSKEQS